MEYIGCSHEILVYTNPYFVPEIFFHSRVIVACPVTTDSIMAMSSCENDNQHQPEIGELLIYTAVELTTSSRQKD